MGHFSFLVQRDGAISCPALCEFSQEFAMPDQRITITAVHNQIQNVVTLLGNMQNVQETILARQERFDASLQTTQGSMQGMQATVHGLVTTVQGLQTTVQ